MEEHEGTPLRGEARDQRRRGRRRGQRVVSRQSPPTVIAGKIPAELPLVPEWRWRRPDDGVNAVIAPPVGGQPDGDEGIVVATRGGGGRAPLPAVEMTTARGLRLNLVGGGGSNAESVFCVSRSTYLKLQSKRNLETFQETSSRLPGTPTVSCYRTRSNVVLQITRIVL